MRKKSVYYSWAWLGILLLILGIIFSSIAFGMQWLPLDFHSMTDQIKGEAPAHQLEGLRHFRLIFLAAFGLPAFILVISGVSVMALQKRKEKQAQELKQNGKMVLCQQFDVAYSSIQVNHQYKLYVTCIYTDQKGRSFRFKSRILRYDPRPLLIDGVKVYYDRHNQSRYFVDIDGSMGDVYE
ncbi:hypothetical protein ACYSNO_11665 [Enterococcus sp. LJL98]